jgi:hypothetical protein
MIVLYRGGGSGDFELSGPALSSDGWQRLMRNVCRLLEPRGQPRAAELLRSFPFEVMDATNHFAPSRSVLSRLPETMCVPSGLKATLDTEPSCPASSCRQVGCQTQRRLSNASIPKRELRRPRRSLQTG